ncbi:MAG: DUF1653 domain-containing protein [Clostridium sp.]|uniref:DUF1653 domain-containing protein n=1 Tax=Clostridium sp. TaxID=1506 RepID=UPI0025C2834C|nr:DUF1653 domain-containing protein [Clostridium sp.]MCE5220030.1 DUF1653 domain-containing protein [Clostridium sp.]
MSRIYKHTKSGNLYLLLSDQAKETDNAEPVVVYQALYEDNQIWVRPYDEFYSFIEIDGEKKPRFELIEIKRLLNKF